MDRASAVIFAMLMVAFSSFGCGGWIILLHSSDVPEGTSWKDDAANFALSEF